MRARGPDKSAKTPFLAFLRKIGQTAAQKSDRKNGARNLIFWLKVQNINTLGLTKADFSILA